MVAVVARDDPFYGRKNWGAWRCMLHRRCFLRGSGNQHSWRALAFLDLCSLLTGDDGSTIRQCLGVKLLGSSRQAEPHCAQQGLSKIDHRSSTFPASAAGFRRGLWREAEGKARGVDRERRASSLSHACQPGFRALQASWGSQLHPW